MSKLEMIGIGILAMLVVVWRVHNLLGAYRQQRGTKFASRPHAPK